MVREYILYDFYPFECIETCLKAHRVVCLNVCYMKL